MDIVFVCFRYKQSEYIDVRCHPDPKSKSHRGFQVFQAELVQHLLTDGSMAP